ncbi:TonB-dependent receptor [Sphingomonas sp. LB-2]|uniref:TonB-dependent receptor n=1 Tax=Sphingomonas caeni TaxID=2984949 RepID=UPI0022320945|nr:TonB-dependent receptor [Sphingomonas caeni]MCW3846889.1 TonB-dependent receptor [Sphingomonas caeni]
MTKTGLRLGCALGVLGIGLTPVAAFAQAQAAPAPSPAPTPKPTPTPRPSADENDEDIIVTGEIRGAVPGDIKPEVTLNSADVRAYGVSSIADLVTELGPQTRSSRGRDGGGPVILLNGRRISSFAELRDLPVEAIERTDILPEEAALKLGYRADQRVVNIVLRPRFRAITVEAGGGMPTAGGNSNVRAQIDILKINRRGRINLDVTYNGNSGLLESERDVVPTTTSLFDFRGNVTAPGGSGEIDPALSGLAGTPMTIAGVPGSAATGAPTLASFANSPRNTSDVSSYRTLVAPSQQLSIGGTWSPTISPKVSASFNVRLDANDRQALLGAPGVTLQLPNGNPYSPFTRGVQLSRYADGQLPLQRTSNNRTAHLGFTVNGDALPWRWSVTGNYDRVTSRSLTDTGIDPTLMQARLTANDPGFNPFGPIPLGLLGTRPPDLSRSASSVGSVDALVNGPIAKLPGGDISIALRVSGRTTDFDSASLRAGVSRQGSVSRDIGSSQLNIDIPISNRQRGGPTAIGNFSLNANIEVEQLSDFGTLLTTGYGAVWSPVPAVRIIASVTDEDGAPSPNQLGDPAVLTPFTRVFDYVRGETAEITSISGGNPNLTGDSRHVMKIGVNISPIKDSPLNISADYVKSTTRNQISGFPSPSAEIEAAFPQRFVRDGGGRLVSVDYRPINFQRADHEELRWGINWSAPLGSSIEKQFQRRREQYEAEREKAAREGRPPPPNPFVRPGQQGRQGQGGQGGQQPPPQQRQGFFGNGGGGGGGGGGFRGGGGGGGRGGFQLGGPNGLLAGRIQLSLYHTIHFRESVVIGPGLPVLDLLNGSATGSRGGQPRHEVEAQAGISKDGYGVRLIGKWQSGTEVRSGTLGSGNTLDFSPLGTLNLRAFIDLSQQIRLVRKHRWLLGTRVTLSVDNIFDARLRVTDQNGVVPLSYQPDLLDPQGRVIRISVRKLFF